MRRTLANRENATHSTGPRTAGGLAVASQNATRHGLTARSVIVRGELADDWEAHLAGVLRDIAPVGAVESALATRVAELLWRLARAGAAESATIAAALDEADAQAHSDAVEACPVAPLAGWDFVTFDLAELVALVDSVRADCDALATPSDALAGRIAYFNANDTNDGGALRSRLLRRALALVVRHRYALRRRDTLRAAAAVDVPAVHRYEAHLQRALTTAMQQLSGIRGGRPIVTPADTAMTYAARERLVAELNRMFVGKRDDMVKDVLATTAPELASRVTDRVNVLLARAAEGDEYAAASLGGLLAPSSDYDDDLLRAWETGNVPP